MLMHGTAAIDDAATEHSAIAGFVAYNMEIAQGIVIAAEQTGVPVLLQAGSSPFQHAGMTLATIALSLAESSDAMIGVHLDHSRSLDEIEACLKLGYTSVMIDGSHLPFDENVALTRQAARRAHDYGAGVEGELGSVAGDEDVSMGVAGGAMTDPQQAADFVGATGIDVLACAVGNVHGWTPRPPEIDLDRLAAIREHTGVPLALHGASGLPDETLAACMKGGVAKVNVNTELRRAFLAALDNALPDAMARDDVATPLAAGRQSVARSAARIIQALSGSHVGSRMRNEY